MDLIKYLIKMITAQVRVGESLTIGLWFSNSYQIPTTCNMLVYIGGVCIGNLRTATPLIELNGIYYTMRLSSAETALMRGYRDLIVVLDDPKGFGNKKTVVGGIEFNRLADEFISNSENQGYNALIEMTVDLTTITGSVEFLTALKGDKGDKGDIGDGDLNYVHEQNISASEWIIEHNLGKYPSVTITTTSGSVVEGDITHNSKNKLTINFSAPFKGYADLN